MSGNPPDNTVSGENQTAPLTTTPPPQYSIPNAQQQVACPNCFTLVPMGTRFCPQCGNAIPPPAPWTVPAPAPEPKRNVALIVVAVVLIVVLVGGVAGYMLYNQNQQRILQEAKSSEANAAAQAPSQLQITCFSNRTDGSNLHYSPTTGYTGYITVYETFGLTNPTRFAIDAQWTITIDFTSAGWSLPSSQTFHLAANGGAAYPVFAFTVTGNQLNTAPTNASLSNFTVTLDGTYHVMGTYSSYNPTTHSTYDSTTGGGNGSLGGGSGLPKC